MSEIEEMKEDGEISDEAETHETEEVYETVERPNLATESRKTYAQPQSDSSHSSSDSDDIVGRVKRIQPRFQMIAHQSKSANGVPHRTKNGSLWQNMIQEETLMETMKTIDVTRKRKNDRGAEAYDFPQDDSAKNLKRRRLTHSGNDSSSSNASASRSRKRANKSRNNRKFTEPVSKVLPNMKSSIESVEFEEFANELAENLEEQNIELIHRVVATIGKKSSLELYVTTQDVEREGGMLTMNRFRRRTPGGVFLFLLKESSEVDEEARKKIFTNEKKSVERKMSADQMSKIPPNSPETSDYVENEQRKTTSTADPNLLSQCSQKILNFTTNEGLNGIEIDFSDEMDVF